MRYANFYAKNLGANNVKITRFHWSRKSRDSCPTSSVFLLGINNVNFYANKSYSVSTKSVITSLVECISFAEDKQGVFCLLFVVFCLLLSFRWTKSSKTKQDIKQLGSVSCWPLWNYTSKAKRNMACAPQLSKHQAAPKLSTTNKPNRQNTGPLATHSPKEKYGLRSSVEQTSGRS